MAEPVDLYSGDLYINRELSWLGFNHRLLDETKDRSNPLLERAKFLAICYSNIDEFFMVRMSGLILQMDAANIPTMPDHVGANPLMEWILKDVAMLMKAYRRQWSGLKKELAAKGVVVKKFSELNEDQKGRLYGLFNSEIRPELTRLALDTEEPFPFVPNNSLNIAVRMRGAYEVVSVPLGRFKRFIEVPSDGARVFVTLEDIIKNHLHLMFSRKVLGAYMFRITKNAEVTLRMDGTDPHSAVEHAMGDRDRGFPVMVMAESYMPGVILDMLARDMRFGSRQIFLFRGEVPLADLWEIAGLDIPELKERPFVPLLHPDLSGGHDIFEAVREKDRLLFHPYEPFTAIIRFLEEAAKDRDVISIRIALYRVGKDPAVVNALKTAKKNGKSVMVIMELRAKFDEYRNMNWAKELKAAGIHVVYGPPNLKVHAKMLQVTRDEDGRTVRYTHLSSGNYNASTARQYGDLAVLTSHKEIGEDVARLFDSLDRGFDIQYYRHLLVAPTMIKREIIKKIDREKEHRRNGREGYIAIKANGIIDPDVIAAMYSASMAGVKIDLNIRGTCCLRPGVEGISDNIRVISIVDRFLEHSRIFYFENGGDPEMLMGSSDLMPRNLSLRVETLFPVLDKSIMTSVKKNILDVHLSDNVKARELRSDGTYVRIKNNGRCRSQEWFIENRGIWNAG